MKQGQIAIAQFQQHLLDDGKSSKTIESYITDTTGLVEYLKTIKIQFDGQLKRNYITGYRNYLLKNEFQPSTINKKINSLHMFNIFLIKAGWMREIVVDIRRDRVRIASGSEYNIEIIPDEVLEKLLQFINNEKISKRNRLIVHLLLYTGLRVSEVCDIKIKNIDLSSRVIKVVGKGGKLRELPIKEELQKSIEEYLPERNRSKYAKLEFLLLGQRGKLHRDAINWILEEITEQAELPIKLKPHTFRHSFCTRLVNKGVPLTTIAKLAGHSSIETTSKFYVNCSKEDKARAVNML